MILWPLVAGVAVAGLPFYFDYVSRDPLEPSKRPGRVGVFMSVLLAAFPMALFWLFSANPQYLLFNGILALAISTLVTPALFGNRLGPGWTSFQNMIEKSVLRAIFVVAFAVLSTWFQPAWWYFVLWLLSWLSMGSREYGELLQVQYGLGSDAEQQAAVDSWHRRYRRASWSFTLAMVAYAPIVINSRLTRETWADAKRFLFEALGV
jgi:hypothetical protein